MGFQFDYADLGLATVGMGNDWRAILGRTVYNLGPIFALTNMPILAILNHDSLNKSRGCIKTYGKSKKSFNYP
jgi:hypothetical protein